MIEEEPPFEIPESELHPSRVVRIVLLTLGSLALFLGILGVFLPGLPFWIWPCPGAAASIF